MDLLIKLLWVALGAVVVVAFGYFSPHWWSSRDARDFNKNPSDDTFHGKFHRQRLTWRLGSDGVVALVAALPVGLNFNWLAYVPAVLAYFVLMAGYFSYSFNDLLSVARKLDYVDRGYVSFDPRAANPDRWIANKIIGVLGAEVGRRPDGWRFTIGQTVAGLLLGVVEMVMLVLACTTAFLLLVLAGVIIWLH